MRFSLFFWQLLLPPHQASIIDRRSWQLKWKERKEEKIFTNLLFSSSNFYYCLGVGKTCSENSLRQKPPVNFPHGKGKRQEEKKRDFWFPSVLPAFKCQAASFECQTNRSLKKKKIDSKYISTVGASWRCQICYLLLRRLKVPVGNSTLPWGSRRRFNASLPLSQIIMIGKITRGGGKGGGGKRGGGTVSWL